MESENIIVPLPYTTRIDRHGKYRMTSHTALITDAALHVAETNPDFSIHIPGENTFGADAPSTSSIMRDYLIGKGIDPARITISEGLNDTEAQILNVREQLKTAHVLGLDFHTERIQMLMDEYQVKGEVIKAEKVILEAHSPEKLQEAGKTGGATKDRIEKIVASKTTIFGESKVYFFEKLARRATNHGKTGRKMLNLARTILGKSGPTVTDYHFVDAASKFEIPN